EVLELRLDAVARVDIRLERRIERRQLPYPSPHTSKRRQNRIVALVESCVAFRAEALDALGTREHLSKRREIGILRRFFERRAIEFPELKRDQVLARVAIGCERAQPREFVMRSAHRVVSALSGREQLVERPKRIDYVKVRSGNQQRLMLVLSVKL